MISSKQFDLIRKRKAAEDCVNKQAERLKGGGGPLDFSVNQSPFFLWFGLEYFDSWIWTGIL